MLKELEVEVLHKLAEKPPKGKYWYASLLAKELKRDHHGIMKILRKFEDREGKVLFFKDEKGNVQRLPWIKLIKRRDENGRVTYFVKLTEEGETLEDEVLKPKKKGIVTIKV